MSNGSILVQARGLMRSHGVDAEDAVSMAASGSMLSSFERECMVSELEIEDLERTRPAWYREACDELEVQASLSDPERS